MFIWHMIHKFKQISFHSGSFFLIWPLSHNIESWTIIPKRTISHEGRERLLNAKRCKFCKKKRKTLRAHTLLFFLSSKKHRLKPQNLSRFQKESTGRALKAPTFFCTHKRSVQARKNYNLFQSFRQQPKAIFLIHPNANIQNIKLMQRQQALFLMFFITPSAQKAHQSLDSSTYIRNCYCWHKKLFK